MTTLAPPRPPPLGAPPPFEAPLASPEGLAALGRTLEWGIDQRLQSTRATLRAWVREAVDRAGRQVEATDPARRRRRQVMDSLRLASEPAAAMLLRLVDHPDVYHNHAALAGEDHMTEAGKNLIRVRIWQIRSRLMIHGLGDAIRSGNRRGYVVSTADAAAIKALWGE